MSEQPVAVCPDCGSDDPKIRIPVRYEYGWDSCGNSFHASTEQGSQPELIRLGIQHKPYCLYGTRLQCGIAPLRDDDSGCPVCGGRPVTTEPTAQTVAGEPWHIYGGTRGGNRTFAALKLEVADLRHQLAEANRELYGTPDNAVWSKKQWEDNAKYWNESWKTAIEQRDAEIEIRKMAERQLAEKDTQIARVTEAYQDAEKRRSDALEEIVALQAVVEKVRRMSSTSGRLGAYLNTVVADIGIEGRGQYFRDLFAKYTLEIDHIVSVSPSTVLEPIREEERERCAKIVNAMIQRKAIARDRAQSAGREGVASHRQSDVETCEEIAAAIRSQEESRDTNGPAI